MKKLRVGLVIAAIILIIADLIFIDYSNLSWSKNFSAYCGIIGMSCVIIGMFIQIKHDI